VDGPLSTKGATSWRYNEMFAAITADV